MGVEFKVGRQDHHKVEDFLGRRPAGVSAITLDAAYSRHQHGAAEAARASEIDVYFDPLTERLADPGFTPAGLPYAEGAPYDLDLLARDAAARTALVDAVLAATPDLVTAVTPPRFYVHDDRSASLTMALAEETVQRADKPVRASLVIARKYAVGVAERLAAEYAQVGVRAIDLRLTPFGGEDESVSKIRSAFTIADAFMTAGVEVVLGRSGNIGQTAVALGHAAHYSVGVGMGEQVNHAAAISRQKHPRVADDDGDDSPRGALAGIYLPGPAATVGRRAGAALLDSTDIRTRIGCRLGGCAQSVRGPAGDPRDHYLHARANSMAELLTRPAPWRANAERDRLLRAVELRDLINRSYLSDTVNPLKTRTLRSLLDDIAGEQAMSA